MKEQHAYDHTACGVFLLVFPEINFICKWLCFTAKLWLQFIFTACNQQGSGAALQDTEQCTQCACTGDNAYSCSSCGTDTAAKTARNPDWPSDFPDSEFKHRFIFLLSSGTSGILNHAMVTFFLTACNQQGTGTALQETERCTQCECTGKNTYSCSSCIPETQVSKRNEDQPSDFPDSKY